MDMKELVREVVREELAAIALVTGERGPRGRKGDKGESGEIGPQGPAGRDGQTPDISHLEQRVAEFLTGADGDIKNQINSSKARVDEQIAALNVLKRGE